MSNQSAQQDAPIPAHIEETFGVATLNVIGQEAAPGVAPSVTIRFLIGQLGPGFIFARSAQLPPELAVQLGEHLIREGNRVKSSVLIPGVGALPADLRG